MAEEEQQAVEQQAEGEGTGRAQDRIQQLLEKIKQQDQIIDAGNTISADVAELKTMATNIATNNQQAINHINQGNQPAADPEMEQWYKWIGPKVAPEFQKRDQAILNLADKNDSLEFMILNPDVAKNPELLQEIENIRTERLRSQGVLFSRNDVYTYVKGQKGSASPDAESVETVVDERLRSLGLTPEQITAAKANVNSPGSTVVETTAGVGTSRAAAPLVKPAAEMSTKEMEDHFRAHPEAGLVG